MDLTIADLRYVQKVILSCFFFARRNIFRRRLLRFGYCMFLFEDCRNRVKSWENLLEPNQCIRREGKLHSQEVLDACSLETFKTMLNGAWNNLL